VSVTEHDQRVTPLELFFDLVLVFAMTQVTALMSADPTWQGVGRGMLILAALWWAWTKYAWLTNALEPEEGLARIAMFAAMGAMLVVGLAVPEAFGAHGLIFGVAYFAVRALNVSLFALAWKRDPDLTGDVVSMAPSALAGPSLLVASGFFDGRLQAAFWIAAVAVDFTSALVGHGRGLRVSPAHFAERHGLIVIIALGESIVSIGIGAAGAPLGPGVIVAALLGIALIAALWWAYFDIQAVWGRRRLTELRGVARTQLARDFYSYLHLLMVAGIVLFALGVKETLEHVGDPLATVPAVALYGGLSLYFFSHVAFRLRIVLGSPRERAEYGLFGRGRPAATIVLLTLTPVALEVSALASLALATACCCALIVYDVVHYREERLVVRQAR
jgi:low temperature requirement protein LtrA